MAEIEITAPATDSLGRVIDFGVFKSVVGDWILANFDHSAVFDRADLLHKSVRAVMGRPFPALETNVEIDRAYKLLTLANAAILVTDGEKPIGVLTRQDIISYLSATA